jgi:hypothetical protein
MHENGRSGVIRGTTEQLSRIARCSAPEMTHALDELTSSKTASILFENGNWVVANRRMQREHATREKKQLAGSKGGSTAASNLEAKGRQKPENETEVIQFCLDLGLTEEDGRGCYAKWQGNGWTNNRQPIKCWRSTIRCWKAYGYMPSQRARSHFGNNKRDTGQVTPRAERLTRTPTNKEIQDAAAIAQREIALLRNRLVNRPDADRIPTGNPPVTHGYPTGNPRVSGFPSEEKTKNAPPFNLNLTSSLTSSVREGTEENERISTEGEGKGEGGGAGGGRGKGMGEV